MDLAAEVFFDGGARYALVPAFHADRALDAGPLGVAESRLLSGLEARWTLGRILGPGRAPEIVRAYGALLRGPLSITDEADVHRMREALLDAVERGHLAVVETRLIDSAMGGDVEEAPAAPPPASAPREVKTWISIVLVDDLDPPEPVPFVPYRIELPDGSTREGILDQNGRARVDGIDPGTCQVTFPALDRSEWKAA